MRQKETGLCGDQRDFAFLRSLPFFLFLLLSFVSRPSRSFQKTSIEESSDIEKARLNDEQKIAIQDQMLENINEVHAVLRKLTEKSGFSRVVAAGDRSLAYDFLLELFGYDLPNRPDVAYVSRSREGNWLDVSEFAGYKAPEEVYEALGRVSELVEI